ncbi:MAG: deoxyhypusine synthase family protein [Candidatus Eisenbacteria bacterium]|uniref:Deoxyhypusine synthase family protein n=1 Tax=Eiseniibacteriota bacterium TaxID=2212470 RepID=A0A956RPJ0_UNCEI|nr:deoxyhypusine synthase family protein [Candidatus Eisenbacteria bacterium]
MPDDPSISPSPSTPPDAAGAGNDRRLDTVPAFIQGSFERSVSTPLLDAGRFLAERVSTPGTTFAISVAGPFAEHETGLSSLCPLLEAGLVDWVVARGEDLYQDADRSFRRATAEPRISEVLADWLRQSRVRVLDQSFPGTTLVSTALFIERLILSPPFQKILSTAELNALLGKYLAERDRLLDISDVSALAAAHRRGVPVFADSPGGSDIGRLVSAAALTGNRLIVDLNKDLNQAAGIVFAARRSGQSAICCLGGGAPRDLLLQASKHLDDPLGLGPHPHGAIVEVASPGRLRMRHRLRGVADPHFPALREVELAPAIALPLLAALLLEQVPAREHAPLLPELDLLVEQIRDGHLRANLERQQQQIQERMRATGAQLQARVQEQQSRIQSRLGATQATIHAEVSRVQQQVQRLLQQVRPPGSDS